MAKTPQLEEDKKMLARALISERYAKAFEATYTHAMDKYIEALLAAQERVTRAECAEEADCPYDCSECSERGPNI